MVVEFSQMKLIEKQWNVYLMIENITTMIECVTEQCHCYFCNNDISRFFDKNIFNIQYLHYIN